MGANLFRLGITFCTATFLMVACNTSNNLPIQSDNITQAGVINTNTPLITSVPLQIPSVQPTRTAFAVTNTPSITVTEVPLFSSFFSLTPSIPLSSSVAFSGEIEVQNILETLYGSEVILFNDTHQNFIDGAIKILLATPFLEDKTEKYILLISKPVVGDCHSCGSEIGGLILSKAEDRWNVETSNYALDKIGSFGVAPEGRLIQIGPDRYGFLFFDTFATGYQDDTYLLLYANVNGKLKRVLQVHLAFRIYPLDPVDYIPPPLPDYLSSVRFSRGINSIYDDLTLTITEFKKDEAGNITGLIENEKLFVFDGSGYVQK